MTYDLIKISGLLDSAKRYVSNLPGLYNYDSAHIGKAVTHLSDWKTLAQKDQPLPSPAVSKPTDGMRRELFRRGLGVHKPDPAQDWFEAYGADKVRLAERFFQGGKLRPEHRPLLEHLGGYNSLGNARMLHQRMRDGLQFTPSQYSKVTGGVRARAASDALANFPFTYKGNGEFNIKDRWDFTLNPQEQASLKSPATWLTRPVDSAVLASRKLLDVNMKPVTYDETLRADKAGDIWRSQPAPKLPPPATPHPAVASVKRGSGILPMLARGAKFMAKVPKTQPFAPTVGKGVRNTLNVAFNPYLGRHMQTPKRLLQGATLWGLGSAAMGARSQVRDLAAQANQIIPDVPQTKAVRSWTQDLRDWPVWTTARTAIQGLPSDIPPAQRDLLANLGSLGLKSKVHGVRMPMSWQDTAHALYSPATPAVMSLGQRLLQRLIPAPHLKDYVDLGTSAVRSVQPPS